MQQSGQHLITKGSNINISQPSAQDKIKNKYNTIDTGNHVPGQPYNPQQPLANNNYNGLHPQTIMSGVPMQNDFRHTQGTQDTTNPSNEVNSNQEYIDILRKVPRILCERYELFDVLGKGAHGRIYLATDLVTHERVAIKLVSFLYYF